MHNPGPTDAEAHASPTPPKNRNEFPADLHCPNCAYCLQGLPGDTCPECGHSLASLRLPECRIPWQSRCEIGRFRAYWRTVWMVTFRNKQFCEEYARPVSYPDARRFQLVTILHVFLIALVGVSLMYILDPPEPDLEQSAIDRLFTGLPVNHWEMLTYAEYWPAAGLLLCFLVFLAAATGVPSYFFHPRGISVRQQNTAVALSYYTSGPLALVPLIALFTIGIYMEQAVTPGYEGPLATVLLAILLLLWWLNLVRLARRIMPQVNGRALLVGVATPLLWLILVGLLLVLLPLAVLWVLVVIYSVA